MKKQRLGVEKVRESLVDDGVAVPNGRLSNFEGQGCEMIDKREGNPKKKMVMRKGGVR